MKPKIYTIVLLFGVVLILSGCSTTDITPPTVSTVVVTSITEMTAVAGGIISTDNGGIISARGVCWSTSPNPNIEDNKLESAGDDLGSFTCKLTGLDPITTYYVRAFATNAEGTAYGEQVTFTTKAFELTTIPPSFITATSAISGGLVSFDNDRPDATSRGVCWSEFPNPTTSNNKTLDGVGKGSFTSSMTGLKPLTTYYVRAYISNIIGTVYGNEVSFTTLAAVPLACFECASVIGLKATFTNCSKYPTTCLWDFGDGTTSIENAPTHVYNSAGTYNVKLVVSNDGLSDMVNNIIIVSGVVSLDSLRITWEWSGTPVDVDMDGIADFTFFYYDHQGPSMYTSYANITPLNNYEIYRDTTSEIISKRSSNPVQVYTEIRVIPKIFVFGDVIQNSIMTTNTRINFYRKSYDLQNSESHRYDDWLVDEVRYVGFRKVVGDITKIGWIKLNLKKNILFNFKIPDETNSLLIEN